MSIRFVIGRAGSGKTTRCMGAIAAAMRDDPLGKPIFLIVPKQTTFSAQRHLTCASGLAGFCRTRVVSFDELGNLILEECGGSAIPLVSDLGRQMVLAHLLRTHESELQYFKPVARQPGLAAELDAAFTELERRGKTSQDLAQVVADVETAGGNAPHDQSLLRKLGDLKLLYDAYSGYLGQERLDQHRRWAEILKSLESCKQLQRCTVYIDGFLDFNEFERRMIAGLARACDTMEISLLMDPASTVLKDPNKLPDELDPFFRTEHTYRRLYFTLHEQGSTIDPPVVLHAPEPRVFGSPDLPVVEQRLAMRRLTPEALRDPRSIVLIEAADRRGEVECAAREIRSLVTSSSALRYRDIVVLARSLDEYHELIDAVFREHRIPSFLDRRRTAAHHPLLQLARAVFLATTGNWPNDAVLTIAKSGLTPISADEADELENYVLLHRIRAGAWAEPQPWRYHRRLTRRSEDDEVEPTDVAPDRADSLRRSVVAPLLPLEKLLRSPQPLSRIVVALFDVFGTFGVRPAVLKWMQAALDQDDLEQHEEHQQVWTQLVELFDQMADLLGEEPVSAEQFLSILESGLERFDLALTPPTVDQVIVGEVERSRNVRGRVAIVLGLNEGQFPRAAGEGTILSDSERRVFAARNIELDPDTHRRLLDENLLAYIAFTRASDRLILTRSVADDEARPQSASMFWRRLCDLLPQVEPMRADGASDAWQDIGTPRQLVNRLAGWVRSTPASQDESSPAAYQWLATYPCSCDVPQDAIDRARWQAWRALSYTNEARLSQQLAAKLFAQPLRASVSRLETFASCPFKHFLRYGLSLEEREDPDITAIDLGVAYHSILEKVVRQLLDEKSDWATQPPAEARKLIRKYAAEIGRELRGELMLSSARNKYVLGRIERTLDRVIAAHRAGALRSKLRPWKAELVFGDKDGAPDAIPALSMNTPAGATIELVGKIDRVDVLADEAAFAVIDYKLSGQALDLQRVYHGLSLQLLTYLIALQGAGIELNGRKLTPAAAFYVKLLRKLEMVKYPGAELDPTDEAFDLQVKPRGLIRGGFVHAIDTQLAPGKRSQLVSAALKLDGTFGFLGSTDVAEDVQFVALLKLVQQKLGELADGIIGGEIGVRPFYLNRETACTSCAYQCVCRFDGTINRYHVLEPMKREAVLLHVCGKSAAHKGGNSGR